MGIEITIKDLIGMLMYAALFFVPSYVFLMVSIMPSELERLGVMQEKESPTKAKIAKWGIHMAVAIALVFSFSFMVLTKTSSGVHGDYTEST